jgi:hypothetical protein
MFAPVDGLLEELPLRLQKGREPVPHAEEMVDGRRRQSLAVGDLESRIEIVGSRVRQILIAVRLLDGWDQHTAAVARIARGPERGGGILPRPEMSEAQYHPCLMLRPQELQMLQMGEGMETRHACLLLHPPAFLLEAREFRRDYLYN